MCAAAPAERPLRRDAERNRLRILEAAHAAFAEGGLEVSMDDIARRAGVGVGTVYRRFPKRELLIEALFEQRLEEIVVLAARMLEHDDPWDGIADFVESFTAIQVEDRGMRDLLLSTAHAERRVERTRDRITPMVEELVRRAQASGALRPDVVGTDVALVHFMLGALGDYTREVQPEAWRRFVGLVLDGLRDRRDAPSPLAGAPLDAEQLDAVMRCWRP